MTIPEKLRLAELLLRRDEAFVRVAECERQIQETLGAPYPFPPLPDLPSLRWKRPLRKAASGAGAVARGTLKLRALRRPAENAYRVEYRRNEVTAVSFLADTDLLRRLLPLDAPEFRITAVAAVSLRSPEDFTVVEELWRGGTES
jgi:hypothetical protein